MRTFALLLLALLIAAWPAHAADPPTTEDIVVERPGPRLWRIDGPQGAVFVLGVMQPLPKRFTWKTAEIDELITRTNRVLISNDTVSVGIGTLIAQRKAFRNPDDAKVSALLDPAAKARFDAARRAHGFDDDDLEGWRPYVAGLFLLDKGMDAAGLSRNLDPQAVTLKKVRKRKIPITTVSRIESKPIIKALAAMPAGADAPCLVAELDALDAMPVMRARAQAWARGDVEELRMLGERDDGASCVSSLTEGGVPAAQLRETLITDWTRALSTARSQNGTTLAIVQIGALIAPDGILARLRAQGVQIDGP